MQAFYPMSPNDSLILEVVKVLLACDVDGSDVLVVINRLQEIQAEGVKASEEARESAAAATFESFLHLQGH